MNAAVKRELAKLERRAARATHLEHLHDTRHRRACETMAEAEHELYEFKVAHGLLRVPLTRETVDAANAEYVFRKLYAVDAVRPARQHPLVAVSVDYSGPKHDPDEPHGSHGFGAKGWP